MLTLGDLAYQDGGMVSKLDGNTAARVCVGNFFILTDCDDKKFQDVAHELVDSFSGLSAAITADARVSLR